MLGTPHSFFFLLSKKSLNSHYWEFLRQWQTWWGFVSFSCVERAFCRLMKEQDWRLKDRHGFHCVSVSPLHWHAEVLFNCEQGLPSESLSFLASSWGIYISTICFALYIIIISFCCVRWGREQTLSVSGRWSLWCSWVKEIVQDTMHVAPQCAWEWVNTPLLNLSAGCASPTHVGKSNSIYLDHARALNTYSPRVLCS